MAQRQRVPESKAAGIELETPPSTTRQYARDSDAKQKQSSEGQIARKVVTWLASHARTHIEKIQTGSAPCFQAAAVRLYPSVRRALERLNITFGTAAAKDSNTPTLARRALYDSLHTPKLSPPPKSSLADRCVGEPERAAQVGRGARHLPFPAACNTPLHDVTTQCNCKAAILARHCARGGGCAMVSR